jgi:hypothetical protein
MNIGTAIRGGMFAGHRTYIISGVGIVAALGAYLSGDENIFATMNTIFTLAGIYFLRKSNEGTKNGRNKHHSRKISK